MAHVRGTCESMDPLIRWGTENQPEQVKRERLVWLDKHFLYFEDRKCALS